MDEESELPALSLQAQLDHEVVRSSPSSWSLPQRISAWLSPSYWLSTSNHESPILHSPTLAGLTIVCISDTHGQHRQLTMPPGDILIHAGDYTLFGDELQAIDFNAWLGDLPYRHKIVVQGNHEYNAEWKLRAQDILSHALLLRHEMITLDNGSRIFGSEFFWPCKSGPNPYLEQIPDKVDIIVSHGPAQGYVDAGQGCPALLWRLQRIRPSLVVSGHVHEARMVEQGRTRAFAGTTFVNAANAGECHILNKQPIVLRFPQ